MVTDVVFGFTSAASFTVVNDSTIYATVGLGSTGYVKLVTPDGEVRLPGFTYIMSNSTNGIENLKVNLYPNPAADHFTLDFGSADGKENRIDFINALGQKIFSTRLINKNASETMPTENIPNGVYTLRISRDKETFFSKVVIQK